jgi:hypothetical protein
MPLKSDCMFQVAHADLMITAFAAPGKVSLARLCLAGEVDLSATKLLASALDWLATMAPATVIIDLAEVRFASAALPNFVVRVFSALPSCQEIILWRPTPTTDLVLQMTDMPMIAKVSDDPALSAERSG